MGSVFRFFGHILFFYVLRGWIKGLVIYHCCAGCTNFKGLGEEMWLPISIRFIFLSYTMTFDTLMGEKIRSGKVGGGLKGLDVNINHRFFSFHILNLKSHVLCEDYRQFPDYILQCKAVPVGKLHQSVLGSHHRIS